MTYRLILRKGAEQDIEDAFRWYNEKVPGLGSDYLEAVGRVLNSVRKNPARYPIVYKSIRRALLHRFPYGLYFIWNGDTVSVVAVIHTARDPLKWRRV